MVRGSIVQSMVGHDSGSFYLVVDKKGSTLYIADGRRRKLSKPKAKNPKHLKKTNVVIDLNEIDTDKKVRRVLWEYNFSSCNPVAE